MKMLSLSRVTWYLAVGAIVVWGASHVESQSASDESREMAGLRAKIVRLELERSDAVRHATVCAAQLSIANAPGERQAMTKAMDVAALALGCQGASDVDWTAQPVPACKGQSRLSINQSKGAHHGATYPRPFACDAPWRPCLRRCLVRGGWVKPESDADAVSPRWRDGDSYSTGNVVRWRSRGDYGASDEEWRCRW